MAPPQMHRFPNGPSPYQQQQFSGHGQPHPSHQHPTSLTSHNYLNPNAQLSPFTSNGALGLAGGLGGGGGFGLGSETGLGSQAARMGFAHGAQLQQQQQHHHQQASHGLEHGARNVQAKGRIREVWKHNLHEEMAVLRDLVDRYPYIAMVSYFNCSYTPSIRI